MKIKDLKLYYEMYKYNIHNICKLQDNNLYNIENDEIIQTLKWASVLDCLLYTGFFIVFISVQNESVLKILSRSRWTVPLSLTLTATKISFMYSFSGNCVALVPISTFMCLWTIYIFPGSVLQQNRQTDHGKPHNSFSGNICIEFSVLFLCIDCQFFSVNYFPIHI